MYDTVLAPVDGSDAANRALTHAIDLAKQYDATLHTIYVVESSPAFETELDEVTEAEVYGSLFDAGERVVTDAAERADDDGVPTVETAVDRGLPHETILEYVDRTDTDLVVMGTSGRSDQARELLGSVAERVIRSSPVPVVTVTDDDA